MADKFDPYREALVVETSTVWPDEVVGDRSAEEMQALSEALHADASNCEQLSYVRVPTGFCREITVTDGDVQRVGT